MFLTAEQVDQIQGICERVAGGRTRSGRVTIEIRNNMPRDILEEVPIYDDEHVLIGYTTVIHRIVLPEEEIRKGRQKNRLPGKQA